MDGTLLDIDPLSGAVETFAYDDASDTAVIHRSADVEPIIERNKALAREGRGPRVTGDRLDMRLAASIPIEITYLWMQKYGIRAWDRNHWPAVKRLLNSNEWRYLRTSEIYL